MPYNYQGISSAHTASSLIENERQRLEKAIIHAHGNGTDPAKELEVSRATFSVDLKSSVW